jgi:hypothetical protein
VEFTAPHAASAVARPAQHAEGSQAETALKFCLLTQMFDPNVFGVLKNFADGPADDSDRTFVV